jgi:hypothetical protein
MVTAKSNPQISLRQQDVVVLLRISLKKRNNFHLCRFGSGCADDGIRGPCQREPLCTGSIDSQRRQRQATGFDSASQAFLQHDVRYCFPVIRGEMTRGMPRHRWPTKLWRAMSRPLCGQTKMAK